MQPFTTFQVDQSRDDIIQPAAGWLDCRDFRHLTLDVRVLENNASGYAAAVEVETAQSPTGPWTQLKRYAVAGSSFNVDSFTDDSTPFLERFVRWRLDLSDGSLANWVVCFRICATVRGS